MPPGSTMAAIAERGRLIVGVDQNTNLFGFRNPASGQLEGFDIDVAREIARAIFGDPDRIDLRVVEAGHREAALQSGEVDLVVRTYSITCDRKKLVAFSTTYFNANQKILVVKGSGIDSAADTFGQAGMRGDGHDLAEGVARAGVQADGVRRDQLDRLPGDAATGPGRRDQHRRRGAGRPCHTGSERRGGRSRASPSSPTASGSRRRTRTWFDSSTACSTRCVPTARGSGLYDKNLRSLGPSPGPPTPHYQD